MPTVPFSVYVTLGPEVHGQMFRSDDESGVKTPSVKFPSKLGSWLTNARSQNSSGDCIVIFVKHVRSTSPDMMLINQDLYAVQAWKKISGILWLIDKNRVQARNCESSDCL
ncbi:hypothetical protein TNCV_3158681 [Trichonephila clavipes]|nr:hypothetical protein TNCV_3158681 [Trichonephila clavipes]